MRTTLLPLGILFALMLGTFPAQSVPLSAPAEKSPERVDPPRETIAPRSLAHKSALASTPDIDLPPLSAAELAQLEDVSQPTFQNRKAKIGLTRYVDIAGPSAGKSSSGSLITTATETVWTLRVRSADARGIRIHFEDFHLPAGASVLVFDASNTAHQEGLFEGDGPFGQGDFYSPTLFTDEVIIEYVSDKPGSTLPFRITGVVHLVKKTQTGSKGAQNCTLDITCFNPTTYDYKNAIGRMAFIDGGDPFVCTGCLLTDIEPREQGNPKPRTFIPYFLSANHCFDNQAAANTLEVYWNYERTTCNGSAPSLASLPRNVGAQILATRNTSISDFLFLRLNQRAPGGLFFLGWDAGTGYNGASVHTIHHPDGDPKEIAFGQVVMDTDVGGINEANYWQVAWNDGSTQTGSSGCPLIVGVGTLIGSLTGGVGSCPNPTARDVFGRFAVTFPFIAEALSNSTPTVLFDYAANWKDTGNTPANLLGYLRIFHPPI